MKFFEQKEQHRTPLFLVLPPNYGQNVYATAISHTWIFLYLKTISNNCRFHTTSVYVSYFWQKLTLTHFAPSRIALLLSSSDEVDLSNLQLHFSVALSSTTKVKTVTFCRHSVLGNINLSVYIFSSLYTT